MSYCSIITFKAGVQSDEQQFPNAWGGAACVWASLFDRYVKDPTIEYHNWMANPQVVWDLVRRDDLPMHEREVLMATFDRAIIMHDDLPQYARSLREFQSTLASEDHIGHLLAWAEYIEQHMDAEAIGFIGTSVSCCGWWSDEDEHGAVTLYDIRTGDKHFNAYKELREVCEHVV